MLEQDSLRAPILEALCLLARIRLELKQSESLSEIQKTSVVSMLSWLYRQNSSLLSISICSARIALKLSMSILRICASRLFSGAGLEPPKK